MELVVKNLKGENTSRKVTLIDAIYGITPNTHAIYLDVKQYLANQRQGTHKSKQRNEVSGSTRKLKKQKGTGGARAGSIKSPLFVGGGRVFGPVPRDYSFKLNKKLKQLARRSAFALKAQSDSIVVVDSFALETPKTKEFLKVASALSLTGKKVLIITPKSEENIILASRNVQRVKVVSAGNLNTYDLMNHAVVLMSEEAVEAVNQHFALA